MIETEDELIRQLVEIKKQYVWCGETDDELREHFKSELDHDELAWVEKDGEVIAFCDWSWIESPDDIDKVEQGIRTTGSVFFLMNVWMKEPGWLWILKRYLPKYRYLVYRGRGDEYNKIYAPRGWPKYAEAMD